MVVYLSFGSGSAGQGRMACHWSATWTLGFGLHLFSRESLLYRSGTNKASLVNHCFFKTSKILVKNTVVSAGSWRCGTSLRVSLSSFQLSDGGHTAALLEKIKFIIWTVCLCGNVLGCALTLLEKVDLQFVASMLFKFDPVWLF